MIQHEQLRTVSGLTRQVVFNLTSFAHVYCEHKCTVNSMFTNNFEVLGNFSRENQGRRLRKSGQCSTLFTVYQSGANELSTIILTKLVKVVL